MDNIKDLAMTGALVAIKPIEADLVITLRGNPTQMAIRFNSMKLATKEFDKLHEMLTKAPSRAKGDTHHKERTDDGGVRVQRSNFVGAGGPAGAGCFLQGYGAAAMSELTQDEAREATLAYIAKLETNIGIMDQALRTAARRFSIMAGVGWINGVDPAVGYRECIIALVEAGRGR